MRDPIGTLHERCGHNVFYNLMALERVVRCENYGAMKIFPVNGHFNCAPFG
jgi:hypothetical protein